MKVLVTGGAGFIGSHLVDQLVKNGMDVVVIDNLATGRKKNIEDHIASGRVSFFNVDIRDFEGIQPHFDGVEWVFHLAALADIVPSIQEPLQYFSTNVSGTSHVLECAKQAGVKRFIYAASSSSYGLTQQYPTPETARINCEYPYALSKYLGELSVLHWASVYQMSALCMKFFNIYGPRSRTTGTYGAVFGVFLAQKINGEPFTVVGDGSQTRDFTYVTDAVSSLIAGADSNISGEVFNVGSGNTYSINRLVELLGGEKRYIPKRPGEPDCTFADIRKIQNQLGWNPKITFEEGVQNMLRHIGDWKDAPVWTPEKIQNATKDWFKYLKTAQS